MILRLILGDQLNPQHHWFEQPSDEVVYVMAERSAEAQCAHSHVQRLVAFFKAMRHFATHLQAQGHQVVYYRIGEHPQWPNITDVLQHHWQSGRFTAFEYQEPDEYRLDQALQQWITAQQVPARCVGSEHFLTERLSVAHFFKGKKQWLMERFYRHMRQHTGWLMQGDAPEGGQWNYDHDNRHAFKDELPVPFPTPYPDQVSAICAEIDAAGIGHFGHISPERFYWPTTRAEALETLDFFCTHLLPHFGRFEDAMHSAHPFLFHSRLSFALNVKLLHPNEVLQAAVEAYRQGSHISLAQIEGFVRQIIGWREYMRGLYWAHMPEYAQRNALNHQRPLPELYWTGNTDLNCLKNSVQNSLDHAYAHHIQRLMVLGNFALLLGAHPDQVDQWYLGVYADALEWVQLPNTRGMSQYADGGLIATKPYISSGAYIHKMSNYCSRCRYDVKAKTGPNACPFNLLYWDFLIRHQPQLGNNHRMTMMYSHVRRMTPDQQADLQEQAQRFVEQLYDKETE